MDVITHIAAQGQKTTCKMEIPSSEYFFFHMHKKSTSYTIRRHFIATVFAYHVQKQDLAIIEN